MQDYWISFSAILLEGIPFILLGSLISGFIHTLAKPSLPFSFSHRGFGIAAATVAGILLPLCECASMTIVRRFLQRGIPLYMGMTYFLSGAILNPITLFTTWVAFQNRNSIEMVTGRFCGGLILVVGIGYWIGKARVSDLLKPQKEVLFPECNHGGEKIKNGLFQAKLDFTTTFFYFTIGAAIAAGVSTYVSWWKIAPWMENRWLSPLIAIFMAQGMSLCSTVDAFIIAPLVEIPTHAKLAFLVAGPIFDLKLMAMYSMIFKAKIVFKLWGLITVATLLLAWIYASIQSLI
jgi:uncharacterized protein